MKVFDLHNDFPTRPASTMTRQTTYEAYQKEATCVVSVFFTTRMPEPFLYMDEYLSQYPPSGERAYAVEDLHFLSSDADMEHLVRFPLLYAGLTWNGHNRLAGGVGSDETLTEFGRRVLATLNHSPIAVDTAHLNEKSFYAVCDCVQTPINSHTCLKRVCNHERNLSDEQVRLILSRGGIIGLASVAQFMGKPEGKGTRADCVQQIDAFVQGFGIDGLCIGTDFNGTEPIDGLNRYSDFCMLCDDLTKLGYQKADIERIFFRNASAFFGANRSRLLGTIL